MNKNELKAGTAADKRTAADNGTSASLTQNGVLSAAVQEGNKTVSNYDEGRSKYFWSHSGNEKTENELHPDSEQLLKVCFEELRIKLVKNQKKYGWSNEWLTQNWEDECREQMMKHIEKGDPRDVAIYAMFMIYRGWSTNTAKKQNVGSR